MQRRLWLAVALPLALAACARRHPTAPVPPPDPSPAATSPAAAVQRWAWSFAHRDTARYLGVFTDDFEFVFAAGDSAGNPWRDTPWLRPDERRSAGHMFAGGGPLPPATDVRLTLDSVLIAMPDPRPGHAFRWYRTLTTHLDLKVTVTAPDGTPSVTPVTGKALFYVVRGDSALLSPARIAAGGRDSTRWYVGRWEDQTIGVAAPGMGTEPARNTTFGGLKALYW